MDIRRISRICSELIVGGILGICFWILEAGVFWIFSFISTHLLQPPLKTLENYVLFGGLMIYFHLLHLIFILALGSLVFFAYTRSLKRKAHGKIVHITFLICIMITCWYFWIDS